MFRAILGLIGLAQAPVWVGNNEAASIVKLEPQR